MNFSEEVDEDCDEMTLPEFKSSVKAGFFSDYDGHGYAGNGLSYDRSYVINPSDILNKKVLPEEVTHVVWFNR